MKKGLRQLCFLLLCVGTCMYANAYDFEVDGIYYNSLSADKTNPTCEVTYKTSDYNTYSGDVTVPSTVVYNGYTFTVTGVGAHAFQGSTGLTSVNLPTSVISVKERAFFGCKGLTSVEAKCVQTIEIYAFGNCEKLESIELPLANDFSLSIFSDCYSLKKVSMPLATEISVGMFYNCTSLTEVDMPKIQYIYIVARLRIVLH